MRIIFLNTWGGRIVKPFDSFIKKHSLDTDIFCFQEVSPDLFSKLSLILSNYKGLYEPGRYLKKAGVWTGQAIFVRNSIRVLSSGKKTIYKNTHRDIGFLLYSLLQSGNKKIFVGNVHGKPKPGHKLDTQARIKQSKAVIDFFRDKNEPKIIGGDFNLEPHTKSVKMFEKEGYTNLIKEFKIKKTRNRLTWQYYESHPGFTKQYFADYIFVSPKINIKIFKVPNIEISDHLPLILDFEI